MINIDGSSTKSVRGVGVILESPDGDLIKHTTRLQYPTTNNEAEYEALLVGLRIAKVLGIASLKIHSYSQSMVGQVNGDYKAKEERM
jgi:ribonuclease HI